MNFIKCEKLEKSMAELQFSVDAEAFKAAVADVFKKEGKKYSVPGFRKGKAPRALIEKMYALMSLPMTPSTSCSPKLTRQPSRKLALSLLAARRSPLILQARPRVLP